MTRKIGLCVLLAVLLLVERFTGAAPLAMNVNYQDGCMITYSRAQLLRLDGNYEPPDLPNEIHGISRRPRRRSRWCGVRVRCRRRDPRLPMPTMVCANVHSLRNKTEELTALARWHHAYRESSLICLTESWLQDKDPSSA